MYESGKVMQLEGKMAHVQFKRSSSCQKCGACMSAGANRMEVVVKNSLDAAVGDEVTVSMEQKSFFEAAFLMYTLPLAALLIGLFAANGMGWPELIVAAVGLLCAAAVYVVLRLFEPVFKKNARFTPKMIDVLKTSK